MRRDHVNQQWRTLRLPRNIHSVSWPICFLVILALYPIVADIILQDMGKSYNYFTFFKIFLSFHQLDNYTRYHLLYHIV